METTEKPFKRPEESEAYRVLHEHGFDAFDERYGRIGSDLLNRWARRGMVRVAYPAGCLTVKTFKKYTRFTGL